MIPKPRKLEDFRAGETLVAGLGVSTIYADFDFETYSPAGFVWNESKGRFDPPPGTSKKGLFAVGTAVYSQHSDCEVLSLAYDLKDGLGRRIWIPGEGTEPKGLINHIHSGKLIEAWNISFEYWVWQNVCVPKFGFPPLSPFQLRCAMAKSRAYGLPGSLDEAGKVLDIRNKKDKDGKRLLNKFSVPNKPTKRFPTKRILPSDDCEDAKKLYNYNLIDIAAEAEISSQVPDLIPSELEFWQYDQIINRRGVQVSTTDIINSLAIIKAAYLKYNPELSRLTDGAINRASEVTAIVKWLALRGIETPSLDSEALDGLLDTVTDPIAKRVLQIRGLLGGSAVKKLYAMINLSTRDERVHDLFIYHSARTGRAAGSGLQPQNFPNSGLEVLLCVDCSKHYALSLKGCPWCGSASVAKKVEWNPLAVQDALEIIQTKSLSALEYFFVDPLATISGCLRGMLISKPGYDLICSDYSAIEAVVLAALAGEKWRIEVFRTHGMIYEMSASKITGVEFDEFLLHKATSGQHHPLRKTVGKVAELASGYQGWIGAWKQFGAQEFFSEDEMKKAILEWRKASPAIVELWGGQKRNWQPEYYGLEGAAIQAVLNPGTSFSYRSISYLVYGNILYCQLPSGRHLTYHRPQVTNSDRRLGTLSLSFEGWNTSPKQGKTGWIRMYTYGGKLCENVVQATARDILAHAIINLEKSGYPVVLHVHDEIVAEVTEGFGSVEEFERIMMQLPDWAAGWPLKAKGGWRAKRYTK